ncbi:MAG TPA: hypothetical protein VN174_02645 [Candidatus Methanoperedens sp.]|nr:hypothetical protein [Candidatus Methanoperedens sp.]
MKITAPKTQTTIIALFALFLSVSPIYAQQSTLGMSAIPPRLEINAKPGDVITKEIKVRNESKNEKYIDTSIQDFIVTDNIGTPLQIENSDQSTNRWTASSWIQVSPSKIRLKPGETKSLVLTVITPEDAIPGGHYAMVLHTPNNEVTISQTGAAIQTNVGTLVYITIPGEITENASIKEFSAPKFSEYGPINFKTTITNLSDIHITPAGSVNIYNMFGLKTSSLKLENTNIFPYTSREFLSTHDQKFMLGRYKAQINAAYGTTGQLLSATIFFWVIPYKVIAIIILTIIIILILKTKFKKSPSATITPKIEELERELEELKKKYQDRK